MTENQIQLVQSTWEECVPIADQAAELFYGKLFELDPELRPLFKNDLKNQGKKLMQTLTLAVRGLHTLDRIVDPVKELGVRHVDYGVKEDDYDTVGQALIWTLEQGLGETFTEDVKEAWLRAYTLLAETMKEAARSYTPQKTDNAQGV